MKKFLAIAAIAATFTACNDEKKTEEVTVKDTATVVTAPATPDTAQVVTSTTTTVDTVKKMEGAPKMEDKKMEEKK
jgi:cytochrome c5